MTRTAQVEPDGPNWRRRVLWIVGGIVFVLLLGLVASATVPRWWAQRVGEQVDGSITTGVFVGLFCGFVFTLVPLVILVGIFLWRRTWRALAIALGVAVIIATPT